MRRLSAEYRGDVMRQADSAFTENAVAFLDHNDVPRAQAVCAQERGPSGNYDGVGDARAAAARVASGKLGDAECEGDALLRQRTIRNASVVADEAPSDADKISLTKLV